MSDIKYAKVDTESGDIVDGPKHPNAIIPSIANPKPEMLAVVDWYPVVDDDYSPDIEALSDMVWDGQTLTVRRAKVALDIESLRNNALNEIRMAFLTEMISGSVSTEGITAEAWLIDARRSGDKNDLQNMESLHAYMLDEGLSTANVKGADGLVRECTVAEVAGLVRLLRGAGLARYNKKFTLEAQVAAANSKAELDLIAW